MPIELAAYNLWANSLIANTIAQIIDTDYRKHIGSSFASISQTVAHLYAAEQLWYNRFVQPEKAIWDEANFPQEQQAGLTAWIGASRQFANYATGLVPAQLDDIIAYTDLKGNSHNDSLKVLLQHVFNHSTHHRGQLVTMLRIAGATTMPRTDFIAYHRK